MSRFLTSDDTDAGSSPHIKRILSGKNVRIASAFLGTGAEKHVPDDARLICDIGMGGTSPSALQSLSKKLGTNLRYLTNLHAKVYLSDLGCIVGSANLSNNGIGFLSQAKLLEAAILVDRDDEASEDAAKWFETLWGEAEVVGPEDVEWAKDMWRRQKRGTPEAVGKPQQLIEALKDPNGIAQQWRYLVTREEMPEKLRGRAESQQAEVARLSDWKLSKGLDFFYDLEAPERLEENEHYISLHRDEEGDLHLVALRFLRNLSTPRVEKGAKSGDTATLSYFGVLDWKETGVSDKSRKDIVNNPTLSKLIEQSEEERHFGHILTAKQFLKVLAQA